ncbi:GntR family transcriptional regulator [Paenibacillus agricola]|uniref:GntR family transcriptional regulator n=1 Tax=Paenibacillus agricola TaxID=2716264 RepID=A0ABX0JHY6_9BACL|nr:GntR family transcriptional regulator [Paenibacillus agricola]NHN33476.1 GntR family transcriptional regulator [Paenibacillus agricola]
MTDANIILTKSIRDAVYEKLKDAILSEQYKPGHHLKERELAKLYGISTTPLKEALRRLEQEGLVTTSARRGTFVSTDIMNSIEEINWARSALEGVAARLAALKISDAEISQLTGVVEQMRVFTEQKNAEKLLILNGDYHKLIRTFAKNNYIVQQIEAIHSFDRSFRQKALSHEEELERGFQEHANIYRNICARDADGAEQAMISHIRRTIVFVKSSTEQSL